MNYPDVKAIVSGFFAPLDKSRCLVCGIDTPWGRKGTIMSKITTTWTTIATVGFSGSVSRDENRAAHGAVCHLQARKGANGLLGRKVNSNGRHSETGKAFDLDSETLAHWESLGR